MQSLLNASPGGFPLSPEVRPAGRRFKWSWVGNGIGVLVFALLLGGVIWSLQFDTLPFYNDGTDKAEIEVGGKRLTLEPRTWGEIELRNGRSYQATATFSGGVSTSWAIDLNPRPAYPNTRAYAAAGTDCFVLLDVSRVYREDAPPIKVLATFKQTHVMEMETNHTTLLKPGPLPKKVNFHRSSSTLLSFRPVPCGAVQNDAGIQQIEKDLNGATEDPE